MILYSIKSKFIKTIIEALPTGSSASIRIKRIKANRFITAGGVDHTGEFTITGQIFQ